MMREKQVSLLVALQTGDSRLGNIVMISEISAPARSEPDTSGKVHSRSNCVMFLQKPTPTKAPPPKSLEAEIIPDPLKSYIKL